MSAFNLSKQDGENKGGPNVPKDVVDSVKDSELSTGVEDESGSGLQSAVIVDEDSDEA